MQLLHMQLYYKQDIIMKNNDNSIGTNIGKVFRVLRNTLQKKFEETGHHVSLEQWLILLLLSMRDGRTQHELSDACDKEKTTITRLIDGLYKKGLITRIQDPNNRRSNLINITQEGIKAEKILTPIAFEVNNFALKGFTKEESVQFISMLNKMYDNLSDDNK